MKDLDYSKGLNSTLCILLILLMAACNSMTEMPSPTSVVDPTAESTLPSWEVYTNETLEFSLEHPTDWAVSMNSTQSGFIGKQVFWWVSNQDPMQLHGDDPAADETTDVEIDGQPARRVLGHYQGAIGDMGFQQYLRYVIQTGDDFYMFTLYAVDALGVPADMMTEKLPISENDFALFEQMMSTLKFHQ